MNQEQARERLEYLRGELRAQQISYGELYELQNMTEYIEPGDTELLEAAGVPEFPDEARDLTFTLTITVRNVPANLDAGDVATDLAEDLDLFTRDKPAIQVSPLELVLPEVADNA